MFKYDVMQSIAADIASEGYVHGSSDPVEEIQEKGAYSTYVDEREAQICLTCTLKRCRPSDCRRYKQQMIERGLYFGNPKHLR